MSSSSLVPAGIRALVPAISRRQLAALGSVYEAALTSSARLDAADHLQEKASDAATRMATLHEAQIKVAPLADGVLADIRLAYGAVAVHEILQMRGPL
jgi:hypothetical protein